MNPRVRKMRPSGAANPFTGSTSNTWTGIDEISRACIRLNELFDDALTLTDTIYPENPNHVVEQFAFSYLFQTKSDKIVEAEPLIHHYWYFKEFRGILEQFFEKYKSKSFEELLALYSNIDPEYLGAEKLRYKNASFVEKIRIKITTLRKWKIRDYQL